MTRPHLPHLADGFVHALGEGFMYGLFHREHWNAPPPRTVPAATDWPDWHWPGGDEL